jgi:GNAT superfamily N-acetyltransferase
MRIAEVKDKETAREFLLLPVRLYKNEKNWIRPLDKDIEEIFDEEENKYFRHGEATRWILKNDQGETIGRVAAFINRKTAKATDYITGGMGFFECINNKEAAFKLFDTCKQWLEERGMEAMDGPINFGERDKWWGLLIDGFHEPNYCMPYHFPYYKELFESYGFKVYFEQYTYHMKVDTKLPELYAQKADRIARDPKYTFEHIRKNKLEKYAEDFRTIYNKAWVKHSGVKEMPKAQAMSIMKKLKPVLDENIVWFAYYDGAPVGFFIMIPELNQIFKYLNGQHPGKYKGKINIMATMKFLWHKWRGSCKKMFGVAFGIVPEFQGKGLEGAIVMAAAKKIQPMGTYTDFEMNWIGSFNPKMIHICESVGSKVIKTHYTYRYLFDQTKEFRRAPVIE